MDKVLSSGNCFNPQSREQPMLREPYNVEPLSLLVTSSLSQRGFMLRLEVLYGTRFGFKHDINVELANIYTLGRTR